MIPCVPLQLWLTYRVLLSKNHFTRYSSLCSGPEEVCNKPCKLCLALCFPHLIWPQIRLVGVLQWDNHGGLRVGQRFVGHNFQGAEAVSFLTTSRGAGSKMQRSQVAYPECTSSDSWSGPGLPNLETGLSSVHPKPHGWLKDAKTSNVGRIPDPLLFKSLSSSITVKVNTLSIFPPLSSFQGLITTATQLPMEQGTPWDLTFHRRMIARVYFLWSSDFSFSFSDDITVSWFTSRWITDRFLMVICAVTMWNLNSPPGEDSFAGVLVFSFFPFVDRFRVYLPSAART